MFFAAHLAIVLPFMVAQTWGNASMTWPIEAADLTFAGLLSVSTLVYILSTSRPALSQSGKRSEGGAEAGWRAYSAHTHTPRTSTSDPMSATNGACSLPFFGVKSHHTPPVSIARFSPWSLPLCTSGIANAPRDRADLTAVAIRQQPGCVVIESVPLTHSEQLFDLASTIAAIALDR
ncbi:hypothetical protein BCV69DRAFT_193436 [Microstroma glucosiphilum]|uniref:Uncharacterized protein n=1 Tax=Pseudomicrostroma glucosiphilum TaxID=1684307 RepID=A0A316U5W6_9BASI|nr:hypothetical protein BCV69DRAFT_193436 [Pseudomicrostroma glucosiphilum]PWN20602.1 hypothetical protein BCV69DRAFT_193436 [Pseudomicrostroma glucosiphilum]